MADPDVGGRSLIFSLHSMDSNDEQNLYLAETIPEIFTNLSAFETPSNFDATFCDPIKVAKVSNLVRTDAEDESFTGAGARPSDNRYIGSSKPVYVQADILERHLGTGESTNKTNVTRKIAKIIQVRGYGSGNPSDDYDCGQIISKQYGGKIIDYNLLPQDMSLGVWKYIWKWGVELLIRMWLIFQAPYDPMVRVRVRLIYPPTSTSTSSPNPNPDCPISFHYHFQFYKQHREESTEETNENANITALKLFIRAALYIFGEVSNECNEENGENTQNTKKSMTVFRNHLKQLRTMTKPEDEELRTLLEVYCEEIDRFLNLKPPQPQPPSPTPLALSSNKSFSWWDVVPIVGSIRTLDDAVECAKAGDGLGTAVNAVFGVGGLALDVLSLGTISTFGKVAVKKVVTEGAKHGTKITIKTGAQKAFKIAMEQGVAKEAFEAMVQTTVTQAARRGIELIAKNA